MTPPKESTESPFVVVTNLTTSKSRHPKIHPSLPLKTPQPLSSQHHPNTKPAIPPRESRQRDSKRIVDPRNIPRQPLTTHPPPALRGEIPPPSTSQQVPPLHLKPGPRTPHQKILIQPSNLSLTVILGYTLLSFNSKGPKINFNS